MKTLNTGKSNYSIIHIDNNESSVSKNSEVIKIYTPIMYNWNISGVFEVYIPYSEGKQHITTLNRLITIVMFSGLLVLYLFLLKIIHTASNTLVSQNRSLQKQKYELEKAYTALNSTYKSTVATLSKAVDARDPYTAGHSERVSAISLEIGKELGLNEERIEMLEISALFHDIGKLGVPDNILLKPGKLDEREFQKIKEHPSIGVNILKDINFLKDTLPIILHHHEKYSGNGYPDGISGKDIPLEARIICVADAYDAMTSDRPYRRGLSHEEAITEILNFKGVQFDPDIVDSFLSINPAQLIQA
jgi:putative nucleotidyltransferase with HDIG domain